MIAIFYELVGRGIFRSFETWALSTRAIYDGKFRIILDRGVPEPHSDRDLNNVEFKVKLSSLIEDLDEGRKFLDEISLVIVWDNDFGLEFRRGHPYYEIIPVENSKLEELNLEYVDKCIHDKRSGRLVPIIIVKDVLEKLQI